MVKYVVYNKNGDPLFIGRNMIKSCCFVVSYEHIYGEMDIRMESFK